MATVTEQVRVVAARRPPGPRRPLLGALISPGRDPLKLFARFARDYGDIVHFTMSGEKIYFVNHPQYVRDVLVTHQRNFTKSRGLERAKKLLGEDVASKYAELKLASAERCPKALGAMIKNAEIQFHHEITNQYLWSQF